MTPTLMGMRLKSLRRERGLTQKALARLFGFNDRQTVSAIETGARRMTAGELVQAVENLGASLDYFTDPFLLAGEGRFSWRQTGVDAERLQAFEHRAGRWIAAYRTLARQTGRQTPLLRPTLFVRRRSSFEDAMAAGEDFVTEFNLGDVPALRLASVMEEKLAILVLLVEAERGISGAACKLPDLDAVLIARRDVTGRRHFNLAHELFHILTWDAIPPEYSEDAAEIGTTRVERLANNFAAAVLMPARSLDCIGDWSGLPPEVLISRLNATADEFQVSASALKWRLVALRRLDSATARGVPDEALRNNGRATGIEDSPPPLFSRRFLETLGAAIDKGLVSVRRSAALLDHAVEELPELFESQGVAFAPEL